MRRCALALLLLAWVGPRAHAQWGPPAPRASPYGFSLGAALQNVSSDWLPYDFYVNRSRVHLEGTFAFNASLELFGRVGGSDFVINDVATWRDDLLADFSTDGDGYPLFASVGVRGTLLRYGSWQLGGSFEAARYASLEKNIRWNYDVYQTLSADPPIELNLGFSVSRSFGASLLYAGPLLHFGYTKVDVRTHKFGPNWEVEDQVDALTIRDKGGVGGFVGWQWAATDDGWHLLVEGAVLNGGFGGTIGFFKAF
jgi:hypothetical protein